jgi:hypothetical protein
VNGAISSRTNLVPAAKDVLTMTMIAVGVIKNVSIARALSFVNQKMRRMRGMYGGICGGKIDNQSLKGELMEIKESLNNKGEYRKANMVDAAIGELNHMEKVEAEAAAMREALEAQRCFWRTFKVQAIGHCQGCGEEIPTVTDAFCWRCAQEMGERALSNTAGLDLLVRMQKMEAALEIIKKKHLDIHNHNNYPTMVKICEEALSR